MIGEFLMVLLGAGALFGAATKETVTRAGDEVELNQTQRFIKHNTDLKLQGQLLRELHDQKNFDRLWGRLCEHKWDSGGEAGGCPSCKSPFLRILWERVPCSPRKIDYIAPPVLYYPNGQLRSYAEKVTEDEDDELCGLFSPVDEDGRPHVQWSSGGFLAMLMQTYSKKQKMRQEMKHMEDMISAKLLNS